MESGEGTYFVHLDLTVPDRRAVVWKAGEQTSLAGFALSSGPSVADEGIVTTASGRTMPWKPKYILGLPTIEYAIAASSDASLISIVPAFGSNTSGMMRIAAAMAPDPELAPLVALAFALAESGPRSGAGVVPGDLGSIGSAGSSCSDLRGRIRAGAICEFEAS